METPFKVTLNNRNPAIALKMADQTEIPNALQALGLNRHQPVLVVIGGASKLSLEDYQHVQSLFAHGLAPLAEKWQACVIDGGTEAGVMQLMGQARRFVDGKFPLIGVCPIGLAIWPGQVAETAEAAPLEAEHTHFFLIPGNRWGDESPWLAKIATELAGQTPSVTILINGGEVTWQDALQNIQAGRILIVINGSGRTADLISAGLRGEVTDDRATHLIASGLVQSVDLSRGSETLTSMIEKIFAG
jgi:SLOG in TRPM, prokaryote